jgi:vacuolar-type H+-ATPase subunit E/Vma4
MSENLSDFFNLIAEANNQKKKLKEEEDKFISELIGSNNIVENILRELTGNEYEEHQELVDNIIEEVEEEVKGINDVVRNIISPELQQNTKKYIKEGLLNIPSNEKNSDPLTPLNQNFVTLDQLQQHYKLFINRIQQQLSTLGGGGETRLRYLDDVVGVATNSSFYDDKFLQWNSTTNEAEFVTINSGNIVGIVTGYYGSFYDTTTQNAVGIDTYQPITINTTDISNQVSIANSSHIVVANSGIYNIQFSLQIDKSQGSQAYVYIWLKKNGTDIPNSASEVSVQGTTAETIAAWNFVVSAAANDYYELMWSSSDEHIQIKARAINGVVPAIPSIILTVVSV